MDVDLIGFPLDLGAGRRGVDMGPTALRIAGLEQALADLGHSVRDCGNIVVPQPEKHTAVDAKLRFLPEIAAACTNLYNATRDSLRAERVPILLGGDHSMAMGSVAAVADHCFENNLRLGVIWLDAHADMNTSETTPSGNIHGMPLAALLGDGHPSLVEIGGRAPHLRPDQVALFGVRDIDQRERERIWMTGVHAYSMRQVDEFGMPAILKQILYPIQKSCDWVHVSFDVDFLDPKVAPGVGTPVRGGPTYRESHLVMEMIHDTGKVRSVDVTELNPILDDHNVTGQVCVDLVSSLFGKRIL